MFDCGDVGRLRGPAAQERELEHLIEPYAQHLDASSRTRATRPSLQNLVRPWSLRPLMRAVGCTGQSRPGGDHDRGANGERGALEVSSSFNTCPVTPKGTCVASRCIIPNYVARRVTNVDSFGIGGLHTQLPPFLRAAFWAVGWRSRTAAFFSCFITQNRVATFVKTKIASDFG